MPQAKATTALLKQLRQLMQNVKYVGESLNAYIVPSSDAHNSEYLADCDKRRPFVSGFTGSAGTAVITHQHACLWTDGRYYLQASQEMDSNWTLMKEGIPSTPTPGIWLSKNLPAGSRVGADPKLMSYNVWIPLRTQLELAGHKLVPIGTNLIDLIWVDRPAVPCNAVKPLSLTFSGKRVIEKLEAIQQKMKEKNATVLVLTALDEIAWTLNLRGSDIDFNPVFFAYLIVSSDSVTLFIDAKKCIPELDQHFTDEGVKAFIQVKAYDEIYDTVKGLTENLEGFVWLSETASFGLTNLIPSRNLLSEVTPVALMKAKKNTVEMKGMRNAHVKDAAALCCYFSWLEKNVHSGSITEISGAEKLDEFRAMQADYMGPSFETISSVGPHGAIIHYKPEKSTDVPITADLLYLCDSGGQYKDGTTDVTRTIHFGTPTDYEKECFTRVLKGQIKMGTSIFPSKIKGNCLDSFARQFLWEVGLDYGHGTGHGIGCYLNVHEGPIFVSWKNIPDDPGLEAGMFISNEPGYYEDGKFGIRIEDIVQIIEANPPHNFNSRGFLTFETVTLVPIQAKMITVKMLTEQEINHLNKYHQRCRDVIGPVLEKQGHLEAREWLWRETEPIKVQV